ncbi:MAG: alpha/beta fold hydrolase [Candidatus Helarchaeota archaeon]|nr:alpha/beta fold hydrolase [Candidatus Helarchaeota archaeon]
MPNVIFVHGLISSGQGFKGNFLRSILPTCLTPDFVGTEEEKINQLKNFLSEKRSWIIIGSSYGGFMGTFYTCQYPDRVSQLILLAPVLTHPKLHSCRSVDVPVVLYHGKNDNVVPIEATHKRAEELFTNLTYHLVDDDHMLHPTVKKIDWSQYFKSV